MLPRPFKTLLISHLKFRTGCTNGGSRKTKNNSTFFEKFAPTHFCFCVIRWPRRWAKSFLPARSSTKVKRYAKRWQPEQHTEVQKQVTQSLRFPSKKSAVDLRLGLALKISHATTVPPESIAVVNIEIITWVVVHGANFGASLLALSFGDSWC